MKRVLTVVIVCVLTIVVASVPVRSQWSYESKPTITPERVFELEVLPNGNVIAVGDGGMWLSVAQGPFQRKHYSDYRRPAIDVAFCNDSVGYAVGYTSSYNGVF